MAWPTVEEAKAAYEKLNDDALFDKIDRALRFATARVKGALAALYDVSRWDDSTPPLAYEIAMLLTYGYFAPRVHTGAKLSASDEAAKGARDYAEELLKKLVEGDMGLLDSSDALIARRSVATRTGLAFLGQPVFGLRSPEQWGINPPCTVDGEEWI